LLRLVHQPLLKGPPNNPGNEHKRRKRQRSLRFAASLLTDNVKFKQNSADDPSDGRLRHWLRWLTWLQLQSTGTLKENNVVVTGVTPHDLVTRTIDRALDDEDAESIAFDWTEDNATLAVSVAWSGSPTKYMISVSLKRFSHSDVAHTQPDDGDDF